MRNLAYIFIALLTINLTSCGSVRVSDYSYLKGWAYKEIPPSQVRTSPDSFYEGKLSDGRIFSVGGYVDESDNKYYYNALYQDLGWYSKDEDTWSGPAGSPRPKLGHLYINIKRGVAVYFYPKGTFDSFKVKVYPKGTILLDPLLNN